LSSTSSVDTVPIIAEDALTQYADNGELVNGTELIDRVSHESEKDVVSSFTERIKKNVDIISEFVATRVIAIRGYFDTIFAKKIHTQELCLDDVCITKTELQSLLQNRSTTTVQSSGGGTVEENTTSTTQTTTETSTESASTTEPTEATPTEVETSTETSQSQTPVQKSVQSEGESSQAI
jgi:hypothetical protein